MPDGDGTGRDALALDPPGTTPHRLTPRALLGALDPRQLLGAIPALIVLVDGPGSVSWILVGLAVLWVVSLVVRVVTWMRFRWGFDGQVVRTTSGIVWHRERALDVSRIQQVDVTRPLLHQVVGTAVVDVQTASDNAGAEIKLDGVDAPTGEQLRAAILAARRRATAERPTAAAGGGPAGVPVPGVPAATAPDEDLPTTTLLRPSVRDLALHAVTGSSLVTLPVAIFAVGQFLLEIGTDPDVVESAAEAIWGARLGILLLAVGVLVVGAAVAVGATLLRFWNVELVRQGDDLRLTRGLLTQTTTTIPLHRLQVVTWSQNWIRRPFDTGVLTIRSAGRSGTDPGQQQAHQDAAVPWVGRAELEALLPDLLDRVLDDDERVPFEVVAHPPAARRRLRWMWLRAFLWGLVPLGVVGGVLVVAGFRDRNAAFDALMAPDRLVGILVGLLLLAAAAGWVLGGAQYRRLGHAADDDLLLVAGGVLGRTRQWMPLDRLQGVTARANWFQRRLGVVTIELQPAGSGHTTVDVRDVGADRARELGVHLTSVAAGRRGTPRAGAGTGPPMAPLPEA